MSDGNVLARRESIAEFELALGRFAQASLERMDAIKTIIVRTVDQLEDRRSELRHEISRLQDTIANADKGEDTAREQHRLEEAECELIDVGRWQRRVEESLQRYEREARRFDELCTGTTTEARTYLRSVVRKLTAYFGLQVDGGSSTVGGIGAAGANGTSRGIGGVEAGGFDPTSFSLPSGFRWVNIVEIDTDAELVDVQSHSAFTKVSYADMRQGLETLRAVVLPAVNDASNPANSDVFAALDAAAGASYEDGLQGVYEAFFGGDPIFLSRGQSTDKLTVTNGRHRIKAAIDAGWTAVPVKSSDQGAS